MEKSFNSGGPFWPHSQGGSEGALTCPKFQNMPDPLDKDPFGPVVVKAEVSNIFYRVLLFWIINVERVDTLDEIHCIYVRGSMRLRTRVNCGMSSEIPWD